MADKRKVFAVTGSRSEYDIFYPILKAIDESPSLELFLFVTGAHLSEKFGYTIDHIKSDSIPIWGQAKTLIESDSKIGRLETLSKQVSEFGKAIEKSDADIVLSIGDREESIAVALAAGYLHKPVAHIGGGDRVKGNIDDQVRFAVAKLSHLHFVGTQANAERLIKMGEDEFRVHFVGNAGLDRIRTCPQMSEEDLKKEIGSPFSQSLSESIVLIQHIISSEVDEAEKQIKITLNALRKIKRPVYAGLPNSDAGSRKIIEELKKAEDEGLLHLYGTLPRKPFVNLLRKAGCLLGNSSLGVLEGPFLKLATVNIGNRQSGREHGSNILFTSFKEEEIISAVEKCFTDKAFKDLVMNGENPYGDGFAAEKIAKILENINIDSRLLDKFPTY